MQDQVPPAVKAERVGQLEVLEAVLRQRYFRKLIGRRLGVMLESPSEREGYVLGTSCRYAPVQIPGAASAIGSFVEAIPTSLDSAGILTV